MRDLSAFDRLPTREELRGRIARPERFRPHPSVVRPFEVRPREDGFFDVQFPGKEPQRLHPMLAEVHRALNEGCPLEEIIERAGPLWKADRQKLSARVIRGHVLSLWAKGQVRIDFEEPPEVFADRFEVVQLLGRGGMGLVFLCKDRTRPDAPVVLKHAWGWTTAIENADLMNRREAAGLSALDHPLIPGLVSTFESEGILHIAREFADGSPLHKQVRETASMAMADRMRIAHDLCASIRHMHEAGLVYLDVKPENFVRSPADGRARLIDLGLCRPAPGGLVRLRSPIGSRGYASPEAVRDLVATPRSDVYGLGRTFFHLATGTRPREKHDGPELVALLRESGVPEAEADLIGRMCAKRPEARPADVASVTREIDGILAGEASVVRAR